MKPSKTASTRASASSKREARRSRSRTAPTSTARSTGTCGRLRVQHRGEPYRVFYAFDPRRSAILLIGGNKTGDDQFYERMVPVIYDEHLRELEQATETTNPTRRR
jgi:hypothetical protein